MLHTKIGKTAKPSGTERLEARIKVEQKQLFERAAALQGRSVTDFVLASAEEAAVRTMQNYELIQITGHDRNFFVESVLNARSPSKKLRDAAARYKTRMEM
jgi:uncharacterized protein (DUF1778 family)